MADSKLFMIPFGASGDRAAIPDTVAPSGAVSWPQGFGPDYERDPATDPMAKRVPRDETNEYLYQITNAIKFLQLYGAPEWYPDDGTGTPVSYPVSARVRYAGSAWVSLVAANTSTPGSDPTRWMRDDAFNLPDLTASQSEANAGLVNNKFMTPATSKGTFTGSLSTNPAWQRLPSGLIMQWGRAVLPYNGASTTSANLSFPIPFPGSVVSVTTTANTAANAGGYCPSSGAFRISLAGFTAILDTLNPAITITQPVEFSWFAIGR